MSLKIFIGLYLLKEQMGKKKEGFDIHAETTTGNLNHLIRDQLQPPIYFPSVVLFFGFFFHLFDCLFVKGQKSCEDVLIQLATSN